MQRPIQIYYKYLEGQDKTHIFYFYINMFFNPEIRGKMFIKKYEPIGHGHR